MRGKIPSRVTAEKMRKFIYRVGDREAAKLMGQSRSTITRIAAMLPVNESSLFAAETKLPGLLEKFGHGGKS